MSIPAPSWLLLFWCGFTAAIASEWLVAAGRAFIAPRRAVLAEKGTGPRLMSRPRGSIPFSILSGTIVFAPLYGLLFEWLSRADFEAGAAVGAAHGVLAGLLVLLSTIRRTSKPAGTALRPMLGYRARRLITRVLYGALLGFLYVVPGS
jgi:hypothetical protein